MDEEKPDIVIERGIEAMDSNGERYIHRIALKYRILYTASMAVMIGMGLVIITTFVSLGLKMAESSAQYSIDKTLSILIFEMMGFLPTLSLFFLIPFTYKITHAHIITSPAGIEYDGLHLHLRSPWENLKSIERVFLQKRPGMAITFHNKPEILGKQRWIKSSDPSPRILLIEFGDWKHSSLGEEIKKYRPDLYATSTGPSWD